MIGYQVPWPMTAAPGLCYDIHGQPRHEPGSCEFCAEAAWARLEVSLVPMVRWTQIREADRCELSTGTYRIASVVEVVGTERAEELVQFYRLQRRLRSSLERRQQRIHEAR